MARSAHRPLSPQEWLLDKLPLGRTRYHNAIAATQTRPEPTKFCGLHVGLTTQTLGFHSTDCGRTRPHPSLGRDLPPGSHLCRFRGVRISHRSTRTQTCGNATTEAVGPSGSSFAADGGNASQTPFSPPVSRQHLLAFALAAYRRTPCVHADHCRLCARAVGGEPRGRGGPRVGASACRTSTKQAMHATGCHRCQCGAPARPTQKPRTTPYVSNRRRRSCTDSASGGDDNGTIICVTTTTEVRQSTQSTIPCRKQQRYNGRTTPNTKRHRRERDNEGTARSPSSLVVRPDSQGYSLSALLRIRCSCWNSASLFGGLYSDVPRCRQKRRMFRRLCDKTRHGFRRRDTWDSRRHRASTRHACLAWHVCSA